MDFLTFYFGGDSLENFAKKAENPMSFGHFTTKKNVNGRSDFSYVGVTP